MRLRDTLKSGAAALMISAGPALADQIELTGTVRDFQIAHPDFQNTYNGQFPLIQGMVKQNIGEAGKPVLNVPEDGCYSVHVQALYWIKECVLQFDDGSSYQYIGGSYGKNETFTIPAAHSGKTIVGALVRVGNGGLELFESLYGELEATHDIQNPAETITVTFNCDYVINAQWRIQSEETFNQWFRNTAGVNQSLPYTIILDNSQNYPGGIYRYARSINTGQSFFPVDNQMFGNEGNSHNYHFTYEISTQFVYTDPDIRNYDLVFNFSGDDDVWVYINGKLVIDLGGVHSEKYGSVNVDSLAADLGIEPGGKYDLHFFFAERHTVQSNFTIETTIQFLPPLYD